jgi:hypothetical protein
MEYFLQQMDLVLPVLGFDLLRPARQVPAAGAAQSSVEESQGISLVLSPHRHPGLAKAVESDGEVTVLTGSRAVTDDYTVNHYAALRQQLIEDGRLAPDDAQPTYLVFKQDVPFKSPSAASSVILNRNSNGRLEWKLEDGRTLKDYQDEQLAAVDVTDTGS